MCLTVVVSEGRSGHNDACVVEQRQLIFRKNQCPFDPRFCFHGAIVISKIMSEMKDPTREFPIAINVAMPFMLAKVYAGVGGTVYYFKGDNPEKSEDLSYPRMCSTGMASA